MLHLGNEVTGDHGGQLPFPNCVLQKRPHVILGKGAYVIEGTGHESVMRSQACSLEHDVPSQPVRQLHCRPQGLVNRTGAEEGSPMSDGANGTTLPKRSHVLAGLGF